MFYTVKLKMLKILELSSYHTLSIRCMDVVTAVGDGNLTN